MMSENQPVTDADLMAYANGQLAGERAAAVEAFLAVDSERAAEVAEWLRQNEAIRTLFGGVVDEPVPSRLGPHRIARTLTRRRRRWIAAVAAASVLFAAGIGVGWYLDRLPDTTVNPGDTLAVAAFAAHRIYVNESRHAVEVAADDRDHMVAWLGNRVGHPLVAPDLSSHGFALVGGRLLPFDGSVAAQIMYEDMAGQRMTLYITAGSDMPPEVDFAQAGALNSFYWMSDAISCAMVGELSRDKLRDVATAAWRQLVAAI